MTTVLVLGTAEWDQAIATNQHFAVRELAQKFDVIYVESMGLRRIEFRMRDLRRIAGRVRRAALTGECTASRTRPDRLKVITPIVLPWHTGLAKMLNRRLLAWQLRTWTSSSSRRVLWLYTPVDYGLREDAARTVYHCVDLLGKVPRINAALIESAERSLARDGRVVAAGSSPAVVEHLMKQGFTSVLDWPNVADVEVFATPSQVERTSSAVFAGNMTSLKVDFELLASLIKAGINLHLAGPVSEGGGSDRAEVDALVDLGATYHGMLPQRALAALYQSCSVGLIPYVSNDYTQGVSPLKTYEYLAAGLHVVSSGVPSVRPVPGHVSVVESTDLVTATKDALGEGLPTDETVGERRLIASRHSWSTRGAEMRQLIHPASDSEPCG